MRARTVIASFVAACLIAAGIAFGAMEAASASSAHAGNMQLSQQIKMLESQDSRMQSELSAAESAARNAQSAAANASLAHLGICFNFLYDGTNSDVSSAEIDSPQIVHGVYVCPQGDTFASVVPQSSASQYANPNG